MIEQYLLGSQDRVPASVVRPGHICGPGWMPIGPAGNLDPAVLDSLHVDGSCVLPDRGRESLNRVCTQALTLRGDAELVARHFGHEPRLPFVPWAELASRVDQEYAEQTMEHIGRAPLFSMDKAREVLGFVPQHSVTDTVRQAIDAFVGRESALS